MTVNLKSLTVSWNTYTDQVHSCSPVPHITVRAVRTRAVFPSAGSCRHRGDVRLPVHPSLLWSQRRLRVPKRPHQAQHEPCGTGGQSVDQPHSRHMLKPVPCQLLTVKHEASQSLRCASSRVRFDVQAIQGCRLEDVRLIVNLMHAWHVWTTIFE